MLFPTVPFLFYFLPLALLGYYLLGFSRAAQNVWLLGASMVFYAFGEPVFVFVMAGMVLATWLSGVVMGRFRGNYAVVRLAMWFGIASSLVFFFYYKELDFLFHIVNGVLGYEAVTPTGNIAPVGLAFYTLQAMSYVIDVYRYPRGYEKNPIHVGLYIAFFGHVIMGPLSQYDSFARQLRERSFSWDGFSDGCCRFVFGLCKKAVLADSLSLIADPIFSLTTYHNQVPLVPVMLAWVGLAAFTLQIYYGLSGYSDMAVGLGKMFGFKLPENFNYPYAARSMTEFWQKWHMSLMDWFGDYMFDLTGQRVDEAVQRRDTRHGKNAGMVKNLYGGWLLLGLWHGGEWSFLAWGTWQFGVTLLERLLKLPQRRLPWIVAHVYVMFAVMIGWVFIRAPHLTGSIVYIGNLLGLNHNGFYSAYALWLAWDNWLLFAAAILFCTPVCRRLAAYMDEKPGTLAKSMALLYPVAVMAAFGLAILFVVRGETLQFLPFRFY